MSEALPVARLALVVILLAAMPWHRPHPNHQFMLDLLRSHLLKDEQASNPPEIVNQDVVDESAEAPDRRASRQ